MRYAAIVPFLLSLLAATSAQAARTATMGTGDTGIVTEEASITCPAGRYLAGLELWSAEERYIYEGELERWEEATVGSPT